MERAIEQTRADPKFQRVLADARRLESLREDPAWQRLQQLYDEDREAYHLDLAVRIANGEKVSPEEIAFMRGFYLGAKWLLDTPDKAFENLNKAARLAWKKAVEEVPDQQEEVSRYA